MLEILISSSVLILVLALLRVVLRGRISARLQYALWLLVLVRLLVPVSFFRSPVSVAEAAAPVTERVEQLNGALVFFRNAPVSAVYTTPENEMLVIQDATPNYAADQVILLVDVARYIWITGMAVMAVWFLCVNLRLARRLRKNRTPYEYNSVMPVYVAADIPSPCLFGLFKPAIYLTERAAEDAAQARQIIAHERTHFRHGDMIWALLRSVCLVVWWFDPFVWLAAALSRRDGELACDEGTIKALGEDARFDYGRTLVGMAKVGASPSDLLRGATTMTAGKKSLKERVSRIANAPKMSVTLAVIVLIIAAAAVGCTFSGVSSPENGEDAPEPTPTPQRWEEESTASDAEALPAAYSLTILDPASGNIRTEATAYQGELQELYALYRALQTLARPLETGDVFSDSEQSYTVRFYRSSSFTPDDAYTGFQMWEDGTFLLFEGPVTGSPTGIAESSTYAGVFMDILDEYGSESAEAVLVSVEPIGGYDRDYWEEVERELASFAYPADIEVSVADGFDAALPEDDIFGSMTLADYIYGTDSWQFTYNGEPMANEPFAVIEVLDDNDRTLRIMDDADALLIVEADDSLTWVTYGGDPVDCADMIRHLLPWARGEYQADMTYTPEPGDSAAAAVPAPLPPELPEGWVNDYILEGDELDQALAMLMSFASPAEVSVNSVFGDVAPTENEAVDFASFVDSHEWTVRYSPGPAANAPDASIILTNHDGSQLWIVNDLDYLALVLTEETFENNRPELHFYDGAADGEYLRELWTWASGLAARQAN